MGGLTILMIGPQGAGKSMMAQRLPGLLPPLDAPKAQFANKQKSNSG